MMKLSNPKEFITRPAIPYAWSCGRPIRFSIAFDNFSTVTVIPLPTAPCAIPRSAVLRLDHKVWRMPPESHPRPGADRVGLPQGLRLSLVNLAGDSLSRLR